MIGLVGAAPVPRIVLTEVLLVPRVVDELVVQGDAVDFLCAERGKRRCLLLNELVVDAGKVRFAGDSPLVEALQLEVRAVFVAHELVAAAADLLLNRADEFHARFGEGLDGGLRLLHLCGLAGDGDVDVCPSGGGSLGGIGAVDFGCTSARWPDGPHIADLVAP